MRKYPAPDSVRVLTCLRARYPAWSTCMRVARHLEGGGAHPERAPHYRALLECLVLEGRAEVHVIDYDAVQVRTYRVILPA